MRMIDVDRMKEHVALQKDILVNMGMEEIGNTLAKIVFDEINIQPTVDAVPVVRCRECENWDMEYSSGRKSLGNYRCICHEWSNEEDGFYRYTAEDDYCSYGERRTDGKL